jgi:hypothetical protein
MQKELANYLSAEHFPKTPKELKLFCAASTLDAAVLYYISSHNVQYTSRNSTWEAIFKNPKEWAEDPIFIRMKDGIKSIRRSAIFETFLFFGSTEKNPSEHLKKFIAYVGGLEKAKECFKSECDFPYPYNESVKTQIENIKVARDENVYDDIFKTLCKSQSSILGTNKIDETLTKWNPSVRGVPSLDVTPYSLVSDENWKIFSGKYQGKPVTVRFLYLFDSTSFPFITIEEEIAHSKLGDRIAPWVASQ